MKLINFIRLSLIAVPICILLSCEDKPSTRIETVSAEATGPVTAEVTGKIKELSYDIQGEYGFCYSTDSKPNISDNKIIIGTVPSGLIVFSGELTGLQGSTKYYVRSFIEEEGKYIYGNELSFTTDEPVSATLTTTAATNIDSTSATCGGNITFDGGAVIAERGVCWDTLPTPTYEKNHISSGTGTGTFSVNLSGLKFSTAYYARAFARNTSGLVYGNEINFNTKGLPVLTTIDPSNIGITSATCGGNITSDGGATIIERGVCWDTLSNPTYNKNHINSGSGTGIYSISITGLTFSKKYYVRAYAVNLRGISYGNEKSFITGVYTTIPVVYTNYTSDIDSSSVTLGGYVWSDGGSSITERGVCWSASPEPFYTDNPISSGTGLGSYSINITGLTPLTQYYYRAYARNNNGLAYGSVYTFSTISRFTDARDGRTYRYTKIGNQYWMIDNLNYKVYDPTWMNNHSWYYNDDSVAYSASLGRMYDWTAAINPLTCPPGWHLPSNSEIETLRNFFGGNSEELYSRLSIFGFRPHLAGIRDENGVYLYYAAAGLEQYSGFWTASEYGSTQAFCMEYLHAWIPWPGHSYVTYKAYISNRLKSHGIYIRCVKD